MKTKTHETSMKISLCLLGT